MILKKKILFFIVVLFLYIHLYASQIKNVIIMIPDGTSIGVLSLARWCHCDKKTTV
ncbi:MAG: hypothetical protein N2053_02650 [Chitinispirillaceae bacterium]|nr:hypothetical protein [Chitinispirillaceae bacterium]